MAFCSYVSHVLTESYCNFAEKILNLGFCVWLAEKVRLCSFYGLLQEFCSVCCCQRTFSEAKLLVGAMQLTFN